MSARGLERMLAGALLGWVVTADHVALSCGSALVCLPLCARSPSGRRALSRRLHALWPLACGLGIAYLLAGLAAHGGVMVARFAVIAARVFAAALLLGLLTHDLRARELAALLRRLQLPASLVELILSTLAFGRQLEATLHAAWAACALRAGLSSPAAVRRSIGSVAGVVLLRAIDRSQRVADAQALRGYGYADMQQEGAQAWSRELPRT